MIEYIVNETEKIKAKNFDALIDKCDKKNISIDKVEVDNKVIAERLQV
jgi:hypothetical protein